MKYIEYIEFESGWRPPTYRHLAISPMRKLRTSISKKGHPYTVNLGTISDEDATYLKVRDPNVRIRDN